MLETSTSSGGVPLQIPGDKVAGFNYQPSYSSCPFETWRCFDAEVFRRELQVGKNHFHGMNTIRLWLSWNAWSRSPKKFLDAVEQVLEICDKLNLKVVLCLFNRWHDSMLDCDGIYLDHFLPGSSWLQKYGLPGRDYTLDMSNQFRNDERILAWDLCNEPFSYGDGCKHKEEFIFHEKNWLKVVADDLRSSGICQPIGIGTWNPSFDPIINDFVDVFMTHVYLWFSAENECSDIPDEYIISFDKRIRALAAYAQSVGKPVFTTETCWGAFSDTFRAKLIEQTLSILKQYKVGYLAYALYESDYPDIHRPENGRLSPDIGHLEFIYKDGTLRPGHDVINRFM